jgi:hypothetical protein
MKKLFLIAVASLFIGSSFASSTSSYVADDTQIEQLFSSSEDVSLSSFDEAKALMSNINSVTGDETTKTGYLIRAAFCSIIGLHRSYMGTKGLWWKYFCSAIIPIVHCVDFWGVVIKGDEGFSKFKGNDKFWVWGKK